MGIQENIFADEKPDQKVSLCWQHCVEKAENQKIREQNSLMVADQQYLEGPTDIKHNYNQRYFIFGCQQAKLADVCQAMKRLQ